MIERPRVGLPIRDEIRWVSGPYRAIAWYLLGLPLCDRGEAWVDYFGRDPDEDGNLSEQQESDIVLMRNFPREDFPPGDWN